MSELLEIITELFETNVQQYDNRNITPLNAAKYEQKIEKPRDANIKKESVGNFKAHILHEESQGHQTLHEKLVKMGIKVFYITFLVCINLGSWNEACEILTLFSNY